jgi:methionyl-tRNA formyltransferase
MHPTRFDHGIIIDQTPAPGIPIPSDASPDQLLKTLGPLGAEMLCHGIEDGLFVPPIKDIREGVADPQPLDHAPKLTPEDRHIDWNTWKGEDVLIRDRALGRLWDTETYSRCLEGRPAKRLTFHGPWTEESVKFSASDGTESQLTGQPMLLERLPKDRQLGIRTVDRRIMVPASVTIEGEGKGKGLPALINGLREARSNSKALSML